MANETLIIRNISAHEALPLRAAILRPGLAPSTSIYPGDGLDSSLHAGAFLQGRLVGVASIFNEDLSFNPGLNSWRLRGMAVTEQARRQGIGRALVNYCLLHAAGQGGEVMWCNARSVVMDFYRTCGFQLYGKEFDIPESGPHYLMWQPIHHTSLA